MKYCPHCRAPRAADEQDGFGNCLVCGNPVVADPSEAPPGAGDASGAASGAADPLDVPLPEVRGPEEEGEEYRVPAPAPIRLPESFPAERAEEAEREEIKAAAPAPTDSGARVIDLPRRRAAREAGPRQPEAPAAPAPPHAPRGPSQPDRATTRADPSEHRGTTFEYEKVVAEVEDKVREGYRLFGLVGGSGSGKTHALKALFYLLQVQGARSDSASMEFRKAPVPSLTGEKVGHYDFIGPSTNWTFLDVGGEVYARLRRSEHRWNENTVRLSRWMHHCDGLFCFLHLRQGHFGGQVLDADPTLEDEKRRDELTKARQAALEDQAELEFFPAYLLFLRALKAEDGDVAKVLGAIRAAGSFEAAFHEYDRTTPPLDIPVMFFFTKADTYARPRGDFKAGAGQYVNPRNADAPFAAAFAARYLPTLFSGVASQVERFKFDFLQSYEEAETEKRQDDKPVTKTYWSYPDDPRSYLSVGLLAGLEFVLRNQPRERRRWEPPELTTRQALLLHRMRHPGAWKGVPRDLLGSWRRRPMPAAGPAPEASPPPEGR